MNEPIKKEVEYKEKDPLEQKILASINVLTKTRLNRINFGERLRKYDSKWKVIIFLLNMEAVFLIVWTLYIDDPSKNMLLISSFFAIYVILLQYFINEQSYSERSLKMHYHQLEINDLKIVLERRLLKLRDLLKNYESNEITLAEFEEKYNRYFNEHDEIMQKYQVTIKNNENHAEQDHILTLKRTAAHKLREQMDYSEEDVLSNKVKVNEEKVKVRDFSFENIFIYVNLCIFFLMLVYIVFSFV